MSISKPINVLVATPCYGGMLHRGYFHSILELQKLCSSNNIILNVQTLGNESLINRARCFYTSLVLANPHIDYLLFIDSDITFDPRTILRMIQFKKEIVCAVYPKKGLDWNKIIDLSKNPLISKDNIQQLALDYVVNFDKNNIEVENGFAKCLYAGTGCMLIHRTVLDQMKEKFPEKKYINDVGGYNISPEVVDNFYSFFNTFVCEKSKRLLSEDYAFLEIWRNMGGDVWIDLQANLVHTGTFDFNGSLGTQLVFVDQINRQKNEEKEKSEKVEDKKE